jgi:hypothetical protein
MGLFNKKEKDTAKEKLASESKDTEEEEGCPFC